MLIDVDLYKLQSSSETEDSPDQTTESCEILEDPFIASTDGGEITIVASYPLILSPFQVQQIIN